MIDQIVVPSSVHVAVGILVVALAVITTLVVGVLGWRNRPLNTAARASLAATQIALLVQLLIGVKLLDQGMGPLQLYVHYMGGILPIALFLAMRWIPGFERYQARISAAVMVVVLASVVMTATIGSAFVRGTL